MVTPESVKSGIEGGLACEHVEVIGDGQHFQAVDGLRRSSPAKAASSATSWSMPRSASACARRSTRFPCAR